MEQAPLFTITEDHLETGLRGYPIGYCTTSFVDPLKGLFYVGHPIADLSAWEPEEVVHLLYYRRQGSKEEVNAFKEELRRRSQCTPELIKQIHLLPRQADPMKLFSISLLLGGILEGKGDYEEDGLNLIAKVPQIVATIINYHAGWGQTSFFSLKGDYIENFVRALNIPNSKPEELIPVFKLFQILHYDHGGGNLSTFVGKAVASGLEDMWGAISAAMNALAGPRHGKANRDALEFLQKLMEEVGDTRETDNIERILREKLARKEVISGFGHAVLRIEDPRAAVLYKLAEEQYSAHSLVKMALLLRTVGTNVLKENPKIADPYPNVDAISGVLLTAAGFPYSVYYTLLFGMARTIGIVRQIIYERKEAREGKGTPIVRPKYIYKAS